MERLLFAFAKTFFKGFLFISLITSLNPCEAQSDSEQGLPLIKNYSIKDYVSETQVWSVVEDGRGLMYFGVLGGILEYDGAKWEKVLFPSSSSSLQSSLVRSLTKDKKGRIYYGSYGDFGYLKQDSLGRTISVSLLPFVPVTDRNFFDIWSVNITAESIYFQSREEILRLQPGGDQKSESWNVKVWKPRTSFMYAFFQGGDYYVHQQGMGLYKMNKDSLVFIPGSEFLGKERVQVMLPYSSPEGKKEYLLGMFYSGLYLYDGKTFTPFASEADSIIKSGVALYKGVQLTNGNYALSTNGKGLLIIDSRGKLIKKINRAMGLQDEAVYSAYVDHRGNLWLTLDNGISKVDIASPISGSGRNPASIHRFYL